jgi:hypothetical protein
VLLIVFFPHHQPLISIFVSIATSLPPSLLQPLGATIAIECESASLTYQPWLAKLLMYIPETLRRHCHRRHHNRQHRRLPITTIITRQSPQSHQPLHPTPMSSTPKTTTTKRATWHTIAIAIAITTAITTAQLVPPQPRQAIAPAMQQMAMIVALSTPI